MNKLILLASILYLFSPAALAMPWHNNPTNAVYVCDKTSAEYHLSVKYGDTKVPLRYLHIWEQHTSWPRAVSWLNNISIEYHTNQDPQTKRAEIDSAVSLSIVFAFDIVVKRSAKSDRDSAIKLHADYVMSSIDKC